MTIWQVVLCVLTLTGAVRAEDVSLRWKFSPDDVQRYRMTQDAWLDLQLGSESETKTDAISNIATEVHRVFDFRWSVEAVAPDGTASISVQVTRVRLQIGPDGVEPAYDSQSDLPTRGFVATLTPLFHELVGSELKAQMNSRGELSQLQIPEDLQIELNRKPAGKALGRLGSADDFQSLLRLGLPALPESDAFALGQQWEEDRQLETVPFGSPSAHNLYRWKATRKLPEGQHQGAQLAVIVPTSSIRLNDSVAGDEENLITGQKSTGEILFNLTAGRLESSQIEVQLELSSTEGVQPVRGTLRHTVRFERLDEASMH